MSCRSSERAAGSALRCTHCGRPVRETQHTRGSYAVDYYTVHGGHGELCSLTGDDGQHLVTFVKLVDHFDVVSCADCYRRGAIKAERDRCFRPELEAAAGDDGPE